MPCWKMYGWAAQYQSAPSVIHSPGASTAVVCWPDAPWWRRLHVGASFCNHWSLFPMQERLDCAEGAEDIKKTWSRLRYQLYSGSRVCGLERCMSDWWASCRVNGCSVTTRWSCFKTSLSKLFIMREVLKGTGMSLLWLQDHTGYFLGLGHLLQVQRMRAEELKEPTELDGICLQHTGTDYIRQRSPLWIIFIYICGDEYFDLPMQISTPIYLWGLVFW